MQKQRARIPRLGETQHIGLILHCGHPPCRARGWVPLTPAVLNRTVFEIQALARCRHCGYRGATAELLQAFFRPGNSMPLSPYRNVPHLRGLKDYIQAHPFPGTPYQREKLRERQPHI